MDKDIVICCENVSKKFARDFKRSLWYGIQDMSEDFLRLGKNRASIRHDNLRKSEFWANRNINLDVKRGEAVGLIGHNGAGKTTLFKLINGLLKPDLGSITVRGRVGALIALGAGFNPLLTGRENVFINAGVLGLTRNDTKEKYDSIVDFAELAEFMDSPVRTYSSGMQVRLGFAIAAHTHPDILLIDEVLAVGDMAFRRKCHDFIRNLRKNYGTAIVLCTHEFGHILSACNRAVAMHHGVIDIIGKPEDVVARAIQLQNTPHNNNASYTGEFIDKNAPIIINRIKVTGKSGENIHYGEPVKVEIICTSHEKIDNIAVNFTIVTMDRSTTIASATSRFCQESYSFNEGEEKSIRGIVDSIPLAPGGYFMKASIFNLNNPTAYDTVGYEDTPIYFEVLGDNIDKKSLSYHGYVGDIIRINTEWEF